MTRMDEFCKGYLTAACTDIKKVDGAHLEQVLKDCTAFEFNNAKLLAKHYKNDYNKAGEYFWLSRNDLPGFSEKKLIERAKSLGPSMCFEDNNIFYFTNLPFHRKQLSFNF